MQLIILMQLNKPGCLARAIDAMNTFKICLLDVSKMI